MVIRAVRSTISMIRLALQYRSYILSRVSLIFSSRAAVAVVLQHKQTHSLEKK